MGGAVVEPAGARLGKVRPGEQDYDLKVPDQFENLNR